MIINHNLGAMNAQRQMSTNQNNMSDSMEKLSSGLRINRAGDDAAGLAISEKMRGQIRGLEQADRNAQDGVSMIQTAEGALNETHDILQRMRELAVQSNNDTNTNSDREEIQKEFEQLSSEITRIGEKTEFNGKTLLNGSLGVNAADGSATVKSFTDEGVSLDVSGVETGSTLTFALDTTVGDESVSVSDGNVTQKINVDPADIKAGESLNFDKIGFKMNFSSDVDLTGTGMDIEGDNITASGNTVSFQIGANADTTLDIGIKDMKADALGTNGSSEVASLNDVNLTNAGEGFDENIKVIDEAIGEVSAQRSQLGAFQNRLEHTINNLGTSAENLQSAESRIRDVDMAKEMMNMTKNNILSQASQSMLAQANQQPQSVLQLLQ